MFGVEAMLAAHMGVRHFAEADCVRFSLTAFGLVVMSKDPFLVGVRENRTDVLTQ